MSTDTLEGTHSVLTVAGRLFAPRAAAHQPARLTLHPDGRLWLQHGDESRLVAPGTLAWPARLDGPSQRITLEDGSVFETREQSQADTLRRRLQGSRGAYVHGWERMRPRLIGFVVVALLLCFGMIRWGVPFAADRVALLIPHSVEAFIGQGVMHSLDTFMSPSKATPEQKETLQAIVDELGRSRGDPDAIPLKLELRHGGRLGANALALPGGTIVVTDQLLKLAGSPQELDGVIAHEIGHIDARHGMRRLSRALGLAAAVMLISGDASEFLNQAIVTGTSLLDMSYSRDFERDADARAVALLQSAGRDPHSLARMLRKLEDGRDRGDTPGWLSTHPPTPERVEALQAQINGSR
ncbi:Zn-dependent protease with chaperone function [plant metagenome]|uniref:Zn-dependent protease with chaperone function n=1 Tax=plant metagenome TaxID=1297885 RepID=A0A484VFI2_9ZZZZ